jgi:hypothetical protein
MTGEGGRDRRHRASSHPSRAKAARSGDPGHRRDRGRKTLPRINADDTDQKLRHRQECLCHKSSTSNAPLHRRGAACPTRDRPGMGSIKTFRILVEGEGEGGARGATSPTSHPRKPKSGLSGDPGHRRDRKGETLPRISAEGRGSENADRIPRLFSSYRPSVPPLASFRRACPCPRTARCLSP